jgi:hypothetical protein
MQRPRRRCIPAWGHAIAWFVPSESSQTGAARAEVVDVGHHRVVREAGLSTGVHHGVPLHELPQASGSSPLAWKARSVR